MNPIQDGDGAKRFAGLRVEVVEPGTKITNKQTGESEAVPVDGAVYAGATIYCTKHVYVRLCQEFEANIK